MELLSENSNFKDKPPENIYKIIKCPLKAVLKNYEIIQPIIENVVIDITTIFRKTILFQI